MSATRSRHVRDTSRRHVDPAVLQLRRGDDGSPSCCEVWIDGLGDWQAAGGFRLPSKPKVDTRDYPRLPEISLQAKGGHTHARAHAHARTYTHTPRTPLPRAPPLHSQSPVAPVSVQPGLTSPRLSKGGGVAAAPRRVPARRVLDRRHDLRAVPVRVLAQDARRRAAGRPQLTDAAALAPAGG